MTPPLTMRETALAVGLSYDRFRKVWPGLCATEAFPAPVLGCRWDGGAIEAWKLARSGRRLVDTPPARPALPDARRARAQLAALRAG